MIDFDTNVLVRFLMQDDPEQGAAQAALAQLSPAEPGFLCREVLVELVWVLERAYRLPRGEIARALDGLFEARELVIEASVHVAVATDRYRRGGAGFADQMVALAGQGAGCRGSLTFDRKSAAVPRMRLLGAGSDH